MVGGYGEGYTDPDAVWNDCAWRTPSGDVGFDMNIYAFANALFQDWIPQGLPGFVSPPQRNPSHARFPREK